MSTVPNPSWKVWGDSGGDPLFEGTEEDAKEVIKTKYADRTDVYLEDPDGREYMLAESGRLEWVPAT